MPRAGWDLFRYPGVRSDSDMYRLGFAFRPWTGRNAIGEGGEILQYIRDTAADGGRNTGRRMPTTPAGAWWSSGAVRRR